MGCIVSYNTTPLASLQAAKSIKIFVYTNIIITMKLICSKKVDILLNKISTTLHDYTSCKSYKPKLLKRDHQNSNARR